MSSWISRVTGRAVQQAQLIIRGHILNPFWNDRDTRRKKRYDATLSSLSDYLKRYAGYVRCIQPAEPKDSQAEPERAFTIWYQGEENAPELVKACFRSMRRNLKQELVVLDEKTLFDWIDLPEHIVRKWREGKILHTQFSDICRVELLFQHGGLWLDATDYVTAPVPQYIIDEDFFLFMAGNKIRGSYAMIQSCFIRGKKGNPILGVWREAISKYWLEENSKIDYFIHHLLLRLSVQENEIARSNFSKMPKVDQDPTHVLWHDHVMEKYDRETFERLTGGAFFQKTNYKDPRLKSLTPGTMAEHVVNS